MDAYWARDIQELFRLERRAAFQKFAELLLAQSGGILHIRVAKSYGEIPTVTGRRAELNQVFMSILMNAIDAMVENGGTIEVGTAQFDERIHVQISDTGKGISPEQLEVLFEPAFVTTSQRVKTGLGLFVSNNIIRKHGGEIWVESTLGAGSKFTVVLPTRFTNA